MAHNGQSPIDKQCLWNPRRDINEGYGSSLARFSINGSSPFQPHHCYHLIVPLSKKDLESEVSRYLHDIKSTDLALELPPLPASVLLLLMHWVPSHVPVLKLVRRGHVDELVRVLGDVGLVAE